MRKVKFTFNYDNDIWEGYAHGTTWNGWDNVSVDEKEHKRIEEYFGGKISLISKNSDGLYSYAYGFTTSIICIFNNIFKPEIKPINKPKGYSKIIKEIEGLQHDWIQEAIAKVQEKYGMDHGDCSPGLDTEFKEVFTALAKCTYKQLKENEYL